MSEIDKVIKSTRDSLLEGTDQAARLAITIGAFAVVADLTYRIASLDVSVNLPSMTDIASAVSPSGIYQLLTNGMSWWQSVIPSLDISVEGLWDFKWTAMAFGLLMAGIGLLVANHPNWIENMIDRHQQIQEDAENFARTLVEKYVEAGDAPALSDITGALNSVGSILKLGAAAP